MRTPPTPWRTNGPRAGEHASFAHRTLKERVPKILDDTVARCPALPAPARACCDALRRELVEGTVRGLVEDAADRAEWDRACAPHLGRSWLDLPWYFAESFFYRRLLEATGYFQPGAMHGVDPFLEQKLAEEQHIGARIARAGLAGASLPVLLRAALWGNRADLSYAVGLAHGDLGGDDDVLVDDSVAFIDFLQQPRTVGVLLDNAGIELAHDLLLVDSLRAQGHQVVMFAKVHPFFVSDATTVDVTRTAALLGLKAAEVRAHPFFTSSGFLVEKELPEDLRAELVAFDVVIAKGDANYRRLLCDAPWPHDTPFGEALSFSCPVLALRTCKSEVLVGVDEDHCRRARARDPAWLTSGRFGVISTSGP